MFFKKYNNNDDCLGTLKWFLMLFCSLKCKWSKLNEWFQENTITITNKGGILMALKAILLSKRHINQDSFDKF